MIEEINYKQRMLTELLDLQEKIFRLRERLKMGPASPNNNPRLLEEQLIVMTQYSEILTKRIFEELM